MLIAATPPAAVPAAERVVVMRHDTHRVVLCRARTRHFAGINKSVGAEPGIGCSRCSATASAGMAGRLVGKQLDAHRRRRQRRRRNTARSSASVHPQPSTTDHRHAGRTSVGRVRPTRHTETWPRPAMRRPSGGAAGLGHRQISLLDILAHHARAAEAAASASPCSRRMRASQARGRPWHRAS